MAIFWGAVERKVGICLVAGLAAVGCDGASPIASSEPGAQASAGSPGVALTGTVLALSDEGEQPVAQAQVNMTNGVIEVTVLSGDDGRYGWDGLTPGRWVISVQKAGYLRVEMELDVVDTTSLDFLLEPEGFRAPTRTPLVADSL